MADSRISERQVQQLCDQYIIRVGQDPLFRMLVDSWRAIKLEHLIMGDTVSSLEDELEEYIDRCTDYEQQVETLLEAKDALTAEVEKLRTEIASTNMHNLYDSGSDYHFSGK